MESGNILKYYKGVKKLNKIYVLLSVVSSPSYQIHNSEDLNISIFDFEAYFKSNILLQYGILGYLEFPFKVVEFTKNKKYFIVETNKECLSKLQLIVSNSFPAHCPVEFAFNGSDNNLNLKFEILKFNHSLSSLINDDLILNTH